MLAQNFLDHKTLGITEEEQSALIKVLGMLERDELKHNPWAFPLTRDGFRMNGFFIAGQCGTIGCIAGWAFHLSGGRAFTGNYGEGNEQLSALFFGRGSGKQLEDIRPDEAAYALRNYLTIGEARWPQAKSSDHQQ